MKIKATNEAYIEIASKLSEDQKDRLLAECVAN